MRETPNIEILSKKIEERPHTHNFTKKDFVEDRPGMMNLGFDPFPNFMLHDIVRSEIVCRELVLHAKIKGDVLDIKPGVSLQFDGRNFTITEAKINLFDSTSDIKGSEFQQQCEPLTLLTNLRKIMAESRFT